MAARRQHEVPTAELERHVGQFLVLPEPALRHRSRGPGGGSTP